MDLWKHEVNKINEHVFKTNSINMKSIRNIIKVVLFKCKLPLIQDLIKKEANVKTKQIHEWSYLDLVLIYKWSSSNCSILINS